MQAIGSGYPVALSISISFTAIAPLSLAKELIQVVIMSGKTKKKKKKKGGGEQLFPVADLILK